MSTEEILSGLPLWATLPNTSQTEAGVFPQWDGTKWVAVAAVGFDETADYAVTGEWTATGLWTFEGANTNFLNSIKAIGGVALAYSSALAGASSYTTLYASSTGLLSWRNGTGFTRSIDAASVTANRTWSMPDANTTLAGLSVAQTFTAAQSINLANSSALTDFTINPTVKTSGNLFAFSVNGASRGTLSSTGVLTVASHVNSSGDITTSSSTGQLKINDTKLGRGGADGIFVMMNNAENGFNKLCFGGISSSFSAIKSSGLGVNFVNALNDTTYVDARANAFVFPSAARIYATSDTSGIIVFTDSSATSFNRLCFGGIGSDRSAIKSNGTTIDFVLANDAGGWANIRAGLIQAASTVRLAASTATVASLNIAAGAAMTTHADGNIWLETDGTLYIRIAGVSKRFTLS